jgi:hypothetical protein
MRVSTQELIVLLGLFGVFLMLFATVVASLLKVVKTTMKVLKDESERNRKDIDRLLDRIER